MGHFHSNLTRYFIPFLYVPLPLRPSPLVTINFEIELKQRVAGGGAEVWH